MDDELARSGTAACADRPVRAHSHRLVHVGVDSALVRGARHRVRRRLCRRRRSGARCSFCGPCAASRHGCAQTFQRIARLADAVRRVLDRRWLRGARCAAGVVGAGARHRDVSARGRCTGSPGLGRSAVADWNVDGGHMAERCGLFIIIALGESLLVTGATFAELTWDGPTLAAFFSAVLGSILMWWIYFDTGAQRGEHRMVHTGDPGRTARSAYTYVHIVIVAGIIVCAVADELVLMHPGSRRQRRVPGDSRRAGVLPAGRGVVQVADERSQDAAAVAHGRSRADRATGMAGADSHDHAARVRHRYDVRVRCRCVLGDGRTIDHTNSRTAGSSLNSGTSKKRYASSQSRSESAIASAERCV